MNTSSGSRVGRQTTDDLSAYTDMVVVNRSDCLPPHDPGSHCSADDAAANPTTGSMDWQCAPGPSQVECGICEKSINDKDLLVTDCQHNFHHSCADKRMRENQRVDCRTCQKEAALGCALLRELMKKNDECKICEKRLDGDLILTECQHLFHRACADVRVNQNNRAECRVCGKKSVLGEALNRTWSVRMYETDAGSACSQQSTALPTISAQSLLPEVGCLFSRARLIASVLCRLAE